MKTPILMLLLATATPAWSAQCSQDDIPLLLQKEQDRRDQISKCAFAKPDDAPPNGVCSAVNWKWLDEAEAKAASCMSQEQFSKFTNLSYNSCGLILMFKRPFYDGLCNENRAWLEPYLEKRRAESEASWKQHLLEVNGVLADERSRQDALAECAKEGWGGIEMGGLDGTCAINWTYLAPAEAKLAPKMTEQNLNEFKALRARYEESCATIRKTGHKSANAAHLCGADWSWLDMALSGHGLKAGGQRALEMATQAPK